MSAVVIIRNLLIAWAPVTAFVPPDRIRIGVLPQDIGILPAIGITSVGGDPIQTTARNLSVETIRERVQVTVYAKSYQDQERILLACKLGPGVHNGEVGLHFVNAVIPLGTNPAIPPGEDGIYERSRDFMVTFREAN